MKTGDRSAVHCRSPVFQDSAARTSVASGATQIVQSAMQHSLHRSPTRRAQSHFQFVAMGRSQFGDVQDHRAAIGLETNSRMFNACSP